MKATKILFTMLVMFLFVGVGFSQSAKALEKATAKVEQLNQELIAVNEDLALSEEQKENIIAIEVKTMQDLKELKKSETADVEQKEQKKAIKKTAKQEIKKNILTKQQRQALKEAKE